MMCIARWRSFVACFMPALLVQPFLDPYDLP